MKHGLVWVPLAGIVLAMAGCGSDDGGGGGGSAKGGSCTRSDDGTCFQVTSPADYELKPECEFTGGTWSASTCNPAGFARKCTQEVSVSTNDGPEVPTTYVYYFPEGSDFGCLGTEEDL